jgi:hypothetical protein
VKVGPGCARSLEATTLLSPIDAAEERKKAVSTVGICFEVFMGGGLRRREKETLLK